MPDKIDVAYVQRVVDEFSRILTQAWVRARQKGTVDAEVERLIRSVESAERAAIDISEMRGLARAGFRRLVERMQAESATVRRLTLTSPDCVQAAGTVDYSRSLVDGQVQEVVIELERTGRRTGSNRTGWRQYGVYASRAPEGGAPCARP
ncbi:MAG: hypothetical protein HYX34_03855 [Actinobacteria bacterium]|nr:hypothetical protein [Actinomycetota bacterium]